MAAGPDSSDVQPGAAVMVPITAGERIDVLDVLRGAALFGILTANMRGFSGPLAAYIDHSLMWNDAVSRLAQGFVDLFVSGKFLTMFAFMFGVGFAIQMDRAEARGIESNRFYVRRLGALLLCGVVHSVFVWWGDILMPYAVMGFVLLLFRARTQSSVLWWSVALYAYPAYVGALMLALDLTGLPMPSPPATSPDELQRIIGVYGDGAYTDIVRQNVTEFAFNLFGIVLFYPRVLGIFLFGLWVWRAGIIRDLSSSRVLLRRCQVHGLWVGVVFNAATVAVMEIYHPNPLAPSVPGFVAALTSSIGVPAGSLFYASTLALLWQSPLWRRRLAPFGAVGRTALTNYLIQSVVCTTLFYSWGGALYGTVGPLAGLAIVPPIYAAQVVLSVLYMKRFRTGPMEWLWRRLTYGRAGLVRQASAAAQGPTS
jgi:uncharacterized protein